MRALRSTNKSQPTFVQVLALGWHSLADGWASVGALVQFRKRDVLIVHTRSVPPYGLPYRSPTARRAHLVTEADHIP